MTQNIYLYFLLVTNINCIKLKILIKNISRNLFFYRITMLSLFNYLFFINAYGKTHCETNLFHGKIYFFMNSLLV